MKNYLYSHSQKGISLMEVVITMGLLGGLSLTVLNINKLSQKSLNDFKMKSSEQNEINYLSTQFTDHNFCTNTLKGSRNGDTLTELTDSNGKRILLGSTRPFTENSRVKEIRLSNEDFSHCSTYPCRGNFDLNIQFERRNKGKIQNGVSKNIKISATKTSASSGIDTCYSEKDSTVETSKKETCTMLGGVYTESTSSCSLNGQVLNDLINQIENQTLLNKNEINDLKNLVAQLNNNSSSSSSSSSSNSSPPPPPPPPTPQFCYMNATRTCPSGYSFTATNCFKNDRRVVSASECSRLGGRYNGWTCDLSSSTSFTYRCSRGTIYQTTRCRYSC